jgi:small-conductance mechanosensitive channel
MFENVVFLFMVHPYDVGDTLFLDADFHSVEEISLNFTVCLNSSNQRVWVPNQRLCSTTFINLSASGNRTETMKVLVDLDTPPAAVDDLGAALTALAAEIPVELASTNVSLRESAQPMKMTVNVGYEFTHSGTDLGRTARTRTRVYLAVAKELTRAGVAYTWPAMRGGAPLGPGVAAGAAVGGGGAELDG